MPSDHSLPVPAATNALDNPICNARLRKRQDKRCQNPAGFRTDHRGQGRCYLHGGRTPIRTGRYSQIHRARLRELYDKHEADKDPLNILPEIAAGRMLFEDFINRYSKYRDALLDWHESYVRGPQDALPKLAELLDEYEHHIRTGEPTARQLGALAECRVIQARLTKAQQNRPRQVIDIASAYQLLESITKMVERVERVRAANAISRADMLRVMTEFGRAVETYVKDPVALQRIRDAWLAVHL